MKKIILEMSPQERFIVYAALVAGESRYKEEPGYAELVRRVAALPCGSPGCSYCDPDYVEDESC
jgi:hypothetical protein